MYLIECFHFGRITNQATATKSFSSTSFSKSRSFTSSITAWQCLLFCIRACDCAEVSEDKRTIVIIKILILNIGPLIKKHITISQYLLEAEPKRANWISRPVETASSRQITNLSSWSLKLKIIGHDPQRYSCRQGHVSVIETLATLIFISQYHNIVIDDVRIGGNQDPAHHLHCTCVLPPPFPLSFTLVHFCQDQHFSLLIWTGELLFIMLMLSCLLYGLTCWLWFVLRCLIFALQCFLCYLWEQCYVARYVSQLSMFSSCWTCV